MTSFKSTVLRHARKSIARLAGSQRALILPPYDAGSLGDQAMLDATANYLISQLGFEVTVMHVIWNEEPIRLRAKVDYILSEVKDPRSRADRLSERIRSARETHVLSLGADVFDGVYSPETEMRRLDIMAGKLATGRHATVLGCSVSQTPNPEVIARVRAMPELKVHLRDPISLTRFETAIGRPGLLVADVAFLLEPEIRGEPAEAARDWLRARHAEGGRVLAVNASGHTLEGLGEHGPAAYATALSRVLEEEPGLSLLMVPHDFRVSPIGDAEAVAQIAGVIGERFADRILTLRAPLDTWAVKGLMGEVDAVLTGRMHLAIAALGMGTAPLSVVYQGKYQGLMDHFGLTGLLMEPSDILDGSVFAQRIRDLLARAPALQTQIVERLPEVKALSRLNFEFIKNSSSS